MVEPPEPPEGGKRGVAEFDVDEGGVHEECVGCGLGEDGVGAGAEVLGADADEDAAVGEEADDCGGRAASRRRSWRWPCRSR